MTDSDHALDAIGHAATELVPELTERLTRHRLGEIEVVDGDLRLRVRGGTSPPIEATSAAHVPGPSQAVPLPGDGPGPNTAIGVSSPAVGFFVYADGLGPGLAVGKGDAVGHIEVLGVRHDVRAPRAGTVRNLVAETGEAVEYGQVVVEMEAEATG